MNVTGVKVAEASGVGDGRYCGGGSSRCDVDAADEPNAFDDELLLGGNGTDTNLRNESTHSFIYFLFRNST